MRKFCMVALSLFILSPITALSQHGDVIYDEDDRKDIFEIPQGSHVIESMAQSTAAVVKKSYIVEENDQEINFSLRPFSTESRQICESERFFEQSTLASCTSFLVAEDIIATAGHCMNSYNACENTVFLFDFVFEPTRSTASFPRSNVYSCDKILHFEYKETSEGSVDFALVKLDRPVENRPIVTLRKEAKVEDEADLSIIGFPYGLPMKVADNAKILNNQKENIFQASLDAYQGNSGSPVFDTNTGIIEGILVFGERDFVWDSNEGCYKSNICDSTKCPGEGVVRSTVFSHLLP